MTATTHGMNPEEVDALVAELRRTSDQLDRLAKRIDGRVRSTAWGGASGSRFKQQWWPKHRASLTAMANDLRGFADSAKNNASEQRRVSTTAGSGGGSVRLGGGGGGGGGSWVDPVRLVGSSVRQIDQHVAGPLGALFSSLGELSAGDGTALLKHSNHFKGLGKGLGILSMGVSGADSLDSLSQRHYLDAFFSGGDAAVSGVKTFSKHPYAYAIGTTAQIWLEAGRAARDVDWSPEGMRLIAEASPKDWAKAFGEAIAIELPKRIPKMFAP